jgi:plasmid stabilization system protein ParE
MNYIVKLTPNAQDDISGVCDYIEHHFFAPEIAKQYFRGIYAHIASLKTNAAVFAISTYEDVLRYGANARVIRYKGFAIIYTIHGYHVLIHRIIHGSLIRN